MGRPEPIRMLMSYAGMPYEEVNYSFEEWGQHKGEAPGGSMPFFEFADGTRMG